MKKVVLAAMAALVSAGPAFAADLMVRKAPVLPTVSPWDIAFGAGIASDYRFRGISQSNRSGSVNAYFEPRYNVNPNLQLYVGLAGYSTALPTRPTGEFDIYGGIRPTFGALALDFGILYYYYPRETQFGTAINPAYPNGATTLANTDFLEFYAKGTYTFSDTFSVGLAGYFTDDYLGTRADGTFVSGTAKYVLPGLPGASSDWGAYISGEVAHYFLGTARADGILFVVPAPNLPDYTTWNVGLALTYKVFTLDLRYHDTNLSREECFVLTSDYSAGGGGAIIPGGGGQRSKWCGSTFVAKLSADLTLANLK